MSTIYRKSLHDKLLTDFRLLKFPDDTNLIFTQVRKFFKDFPEIGPTCAIMPTTPAVEVAGLTSNDRVLGYAAIVYDYVEAADDADVADDMIERLEDIEDMIVAYLEQIPNPVEREVTDVHAYKINVLPSLYSYENDAGGVRLYLQLDFNIYCNVNI